MMKEKPELASEALILHNNLIRKAKWANIGFTIEQEGDSYCIAFHDPADAAKFCLQVCGGVLAGPGSDSDPG